VTGASSATGGTIPAIVLRAGEIALAILAVMLAVLGIWMLRSPAGKEGGNIELVLALRHWALS
jgi:hypothetical protein